MFYLAIRIPPLSYPFVIPFPLSPVSSCSPIGISGLICSNTNQHAVLNLYRRQAASAPLTTPSLLRSSRTRSLMQHRFWLTSLHIHATSFAAYDELTLPINSCTFLTRAPNPLTPTLHWRYNSTSSTLLSYPCSKSTLPRATQQIHYHLHYTSATAAAFTFSSNTPSIIPLLHRLNYHHLPHLQRKLFTTATCVYLSRTPLHDYMISPTSSLLQTDLTPRASTSAVNGQLPLTQWST